MSTSSSASQSEGINLSVVFAPIYWGFVISLVLAGVTVLQGYLYFPNNNDKLSVRLIAATMLILDILSSSLVAQSVYFYLVPHFGSTVPLNSVTTELSVECLFSSIITLISQLYFVRQLMAVSKVNSRTWWSNPCGLANALIAFLAILTFAFGVGCTSVMITHKHSVLSNKAPSFKLIFGLAKGAGALTDILATIAMCVFLSAARTGMSGTNSIIKSLMHFAINRGILVTLIQLSVFVFFFAFEQRLYWFAFHVNVTKLYVNTFFAMLNSRTYLNQKQGCVSIYNTPPPNVMGQYRNVISLGKDSNSPQISPIMKYHPDKTSPSLAANNSFEE